jgi:hypothetical protein
MICGTENDAYKPSIKSDRLNLTLKKLCSEITGEGEIVYSYVIDTIERQNNCFLQTGCGPNFQGDLITLCTCKHQMRASLKQSNHWKNKWIAGFTGFKAGKGKNVLVYLMQVGDAYESHSELWYKLPGKARRKKAASENTLGDIYEPKWNLSGEDRFEPANYHRPIKGHSHLKNKKCKDKWHKDINYKHMRWGRWPALLVGRASKSFVWDRPTIYLEKDRVPRHCRKFEDGILNFLDKLAPVED